MKYIKQCYHPNFTLPSCYRPSLGSSKWKSTVSVFCLFFVSTCCLSLQLHNYLCLISECLNPPLDSAWWGQTSFYVVLSVLWPAEFVLSCFSCVWPMDGSSLSSSVHEILQARILEWVAMPFSRRSSWSKDRTHISDVSCIGRWVLYH